MKKKNKIAAFTLSEVIVVLIITSIVVMMAFSVLTLVQKQMLFIEKNFTKNNLIHQLDYQLWLDFNTYQSITYKKTTSELIFMTEIDSLVYKFERNNIIKLGDTIHLTLSNKEFFFDGKLVKEGNVDAIKLSLSTEDENKFLFVYKVNDATQFVNN